MQAGPFPAHNFYMRRSVFLFVVTACASTALAQIPDFVPCKFGEVTTVTHRADVTVRRVAIVEASGPLSATVFIPDRDLPVPGIIFTHSAIQGDSVRTDLQRFAAALALAGAASIVLDGTIDWTAPQKDPRVPSAHALACAGQWLLLNAKLARERLAVAGPETLSGWGGGMTPICMSKEQPCWHPSLWLNFGQTTTASYGNTNSILTEVGQFGLAKWVKDKLKLGELRREWFTLNSELP